MLRWGPHLREKGKYLQENSTPRCFFSDLTDYALFSLFTFPNLIPQIAIAYWGPNIFLNFNYPSFKKDGRSTSLL